MAHSNSSLTAQSLTEPLFRRIRPSASVQSCSIEDNPQIAHSVSGQHPDIIRRNTDGEVNDQASIPIHSSSSQGSKFLLAVDFGTTYSTVSYAKINQGIDSTSLGINDIQCIDSYAKAVGRTDSRNNCRIDNVPTEILYIGPAISTADIHDSDSDPDSDTLSETSSFSIVVPEADENGKGIGRPRQKKRKRRAAKTGTDIAQRKWTRPREISLKWGFHVQDMQKYPQQLQSYQSSEAVKLIKLSLGDEAKHLTEKRKELAEQVERLQSLHFVQNRDHILQDYLTRLLNHARSVLRENSGLNDHSELEFVLCVPVSWSESACRIMHDAMARAIQNCRLESLEENVISNLFIVSEPEAAAQFVLASLGRNGRLSKNEVFILLDAGGAQWILRRTE
ncbi:uncharacterized protein A1O9_08579 [Exophiala aquamarina CBS 119918]|uniref:Hsp70-like protein n=1 Tax=Exophiala aquamarina CBS 119918 TaxID=1182545 RepID=A0A072P989_9EURO|nr:uncharacterized protein A1O9_08579 [Exophiala aquamarina CBS 119918]KEF55828.1 hypothetical protein A1O9_08579 [Exophiala aquamarina CBS 119918]